MRNQPRYRLAMPQRLATGGEVQLSGNAAHYAGHVLRLREGDQIALFNGTDGEFAATIIRVGKKDISLTTGGRLRGPEAGTGLTVCFAPVKGGRLETIIEKATELGADVLQPILTQRSVVDKVNVERAESIAREAAEQCERVNWPEIREPVKLLKLLGDWPADMPLIYGDESGEGIAITEWQVSARSAEIARAAKRQGSAEGEGGVSPPSDTKWAILTGPEGGFSPEEFTALRRVKSAVGVGLGPRILRADTAVITLCVATLMAWGDWHRAPRFIQETDA